MTSTLSVSCHNIKVTEAVKDGDTLTFVIVSKKVRNCLIYLRVLAHLSWRCTSDTRLHYRFNYDTEDKIPGYRLRYHPCFLQLSGTGEYHVDRTYDDFEWLQQHLFSQEDVAGIQGVIVSTFISS